MLVQTDKKYTEFFFQRHLLNKICHYLVLLTYEIFAFFSLCVCVCVASLYFKEMAVRRNDKRTMRTFGGLKGSINTGKTIIQLDHGLMCIRMESWTTFELCEANERPKEKPYVQWMDFKNLQSGIFVTQSFFFFIINLLYSLYIEIISRRRVILLSTNWNLDSHTKISELIVFVHILLKSYLGCNISCCSGLLLKRKVKNLFLRVAFFVGHSLHTCNPLLVLFLILLLITKQW